ncbi:hypothetical protein SO802_018738 [Lithocarpus litseifolius]|uniref:Protein kinase domain-containing protein n=1 Tax=Lithocarpus litseifolius TaxID=425828 RepID=A0AAW2CRD7_9ROSI
MGWKREFTYAELQAATDGFSDENCLSVGGLGPTFRGQLENKLKIIVKQLKNTSQGQKSFDLEVHVLSRAVLSRARHANVVMLLGSCVEGSHMLLVYEYACNGQSSTPLSWTDRIKIALGISRGLHYLHENNIIHGDIKPKNILLNHDFAPLLGGFGLARKHYKTDHFSKDKIDATSAYSAPEHAESGKLSTKTDVYSFGMVLLELITGQRTKDKTLGKKCLVGWAKPLLKERKYLQLVNPKIGNSHDFHQLLGIVQVIEQCLSKNPKKRLSMDQVVSALEGVTGRKSCCATSESSPVQSYLVPCKSTITCSQSHYRIIEQATLSKEVIKNYMVRPFPLASRSSTSSSAVEKSHRITTAKAERRIQLCYGEMLN